jgi:F-type H+-transporting ATPase subunit gamma
LSQRREIEARLELHDDLTGILRAMRSFALTELHRVTRREGAQAEVVKTLQLALGDMAPALPTPPQCSGDIWLLLGSVRGFCGGFNEEVVRQWRADAGAGAPAVLVGERLAAGVEGAGDRLLVPGPVGALDAGATVDRILAALDAARGKLPGEAGLMVCYRDEAQARSERLWPFVLPHSDRAGTPPLTLEPAGRVAARLLEQHLFHALLARVLRAIRVENHMRLVQMESALAHLDRASETLRRQRNRLRQEEIVEEIELIVQSREDRPRHGA